MESWFPGESQKAKPTEPTAPTSSPEIPPSPAISDEEPPWPVASFPGESRDDELSEEATEVAPSRSPQNLVDDPRVQKLLRTFGGRIRKVVRDAPKTLEPEASVEGAAPQSDESSDE